MAGQSARPATAAVFIQHLKSALDDPGCHAWIAWTPAGDAIQIPRDHGTNGHQMIKGLKTHFGNMRIESFYRQLRSYNFRQLTDGRRARHGYTTGAGQEEESGYMTGASAGTSIYRNSLFHRDHPERFVHIQRHKLAKASQRRSASREPSPEPAPAAEANDNAPLAQANASPALLPSHTPRRPREGGSHQSTGSGHGVEALLALAIRSGREVNVPSQRRSGEGPMPSSHTTGQDDDKRHRQMAVPSEGQRPRGSDALSTHTLTKRAESPQDDRSTARGTHGTVSPNDLLQGSPQMAFGTTYRPPAANTDRVDDEREIRPPMPAPMAEAMPEVTPDMPQTLSVYAPRPLTTFAASPQDSRAASLPARSEASAEQTSPHIPVSTAITPVVAPSMPSLVPARAHHIKPPLGLQGDAELLALARAKVTDMAAVLDLMSHSLGEARARSLPLELERVHGMISMLRELDLTLYILSHSKA